MDRPTRWEKCKSLKEMNKENMNVVLSKRYLDKKGVCQYLGVSIGKLEKLMFNKDLKYVKFGRNVRFDLEDVDEFMERNKI